MHNRSKETFWYTIDYVKNFSIYLKGTWKVVRYTDWYVEEPHDPQDVVHAKNDNSYVYRHRNMSSNLSLKLLRILIYATVQFYLDG